MERATPVRKPHTSTADLLTWSETPAENISTSSSTRSTTQSSHQPSDGISKVLFGGQVTDDEAEALNGRPIDVKGLRSLLDSLVTAPLPLRLVGDCSNFAMFRKHCSDYKLKEMTGSQIFGADGEGTVAESGVSNNRTSVRIVQQAANGISQISFSTEETVSTKKPSTLTEVAKQRELSGTVGSEHDSKTGKHLSDAKSKELSGHDIFGAPIEVPPRSLAAARSLESKESKDVGEPVPRNLRTSVKVSNPAGGQSNIVFGEEPVVKTAKKIHNQKFAELTGNDIFKGDAPPGSAEKPLSMAKLKEMSGSDIFADGKVESREYFGGVRKPPGGESSISLV